MHECAFACIVYICLYDQAPLNHAQLIRLTTLHQLVDHALILINPKVARLLEGRRLHVEQYLLWHLSGT